MVRFLMSRGQTHKQIAAAIGCNFWTIRRVSCLPDAAMQWRYAEALTKLFKCHQHDPEDHSVPGPKGGSKAMHEQAKQE